jgi:tetratricopeptide (TPR) repeat protein
MGEMGGARQSFAEDVRRKSKMKIGIRRESPHEIDLTLTRGSSSVPLVLHYLSVKIQAKGHAMSEDIRRPDVLTVLSDMQSLTRAIDTDPQNTQLYIKRGMASFQLGNIAAAIDDFDRAERLNPALSPDLWQRGIAYYYAERFEDGAKQFETDLTVNGHDVEETVWRYLCQAQPQGAEAARHAMLPVRDDSRPVMSWVYQLFAGTCEPEAVIAHYGDAERRERFYSALYVGLYYEAKRDPERARHYVSLAADMRVTEDYMGWVAIVHQRLRGWTQDRGNAP